MPKSSIFLQLALKKLGCQLKCVTCVSMELIEPLFTNILTKYKLHKGKNSCPFHSFLYSHYVVHMDT